MKKETTISILGCGWLGLPLGKHLVTKGYIIKGSTQTAQKLNILHQNGITPFIIEVNKKIKGNNLPQFFHSDILIINIPPNRKRKDVVRSHPQQIIAIIQKAKQFGVKKVLFISSTNVYGNVNRIVTESDEPRPETQSAVALVKVENLLMGQDFFETTIIRFGGLVGADREAGRFLAGKKEVKNGLAPVNMIHQTDCIGIITQVIEQECWGDIFNACADKHPTKQDFYSTQAQKLGLKRPDFLEEEVFVFKKVSNYKLKQALSYEFINPDPLKF